MRCKRGQFFLLAAVIISSVVISLGIQANSAQINPELAGFSDFSYDVKRETSSVIDYEIYTNFNSPKLEEFVDLLSSDIRDRNPDANFLFIYGDNNDLTIRNYGAEIARAYACDPANPSCNPQEVPGAGFPVQSFITIGGINTPIQGTYDNRGNLWQESFSGVEDFTIDIRGNNYRFDISEYKQVIFVIQKDVGGESYVEVV